MKLEDILGLAIPVAFVIAWVSEYLVNRAGGGRRFPAVKGWVVMGSLFFVLFAAVNVTLPLWLPPEWLAAHRLMDLTGLGLWGAPIAYVAISFFSYVFHRAEHRFTLMWRGFHQMHHAIERVDMGGWAVGHPLETVVQGVIITGLSTLVLGIDPVAVAIAGTVGTMIVMLPHWNGPTPHWLGYVLMRPEMHCLHHERDVHARNYSNDLVLWDQLFGSYANPRDFTGDVGFGHSSIRALPAMFAFQDVNVARSAQQ